MHVLLLRICAGIFLKLQIKALKIVFDHHIKFHEDRIWLTRYLQKNTGICCRTPVLGLGLGVDFTFAMTEKTTATLGENHGNP